MTSLNWTLISKKAVAVAVLAVAALLALSGCKDTGQEAVKRPRRAEAPEHDCRKHTEDKICAIPWKDKVVLYCYKGRIPRVVRYREEC